MAGKPFCFESRVVYGMLLDSMQAVCLFLLWKICVAVWVAAVGNSTDFPSSFIYFCDMSHVGDMSIN